MSDSLAISLRPASEPFLAATQLPGRQFEPELRRVLVVDPMYRLPQLALSAAVQQASGGRLTTARNVIDAMRFVVSARPPVVIAAWSMQLPELFGVLAEYCAPGCFPQIIVAAHRRRDFEIAVTRCERFPVIVVQEYELIRYLVQWFATQAVH